MYTRNILLLATTLILLVFFTFKNISSIGLSTSHVQMVTIDDNGFLPETLTIKEGTKVIWKASGKHLHWPASNPHPVHTDYPESGGCISSALDSCYGLKSGEEFSFVFNKLGDWGIHDHLFPGSVMSVKVVSRTASTTTLVFSKDLVSPSEFKSLDYSRQLETIKKLSALDPAKAWDYIKKSFIINGQVVGNAHEMAHIVGHNAYAKFGLDGVKICDDSFAFGCFHGVTEAMLLKEGVKSISRIEQGCLDRFPPKSSSDYTGCIHGTGHGVYSLEGADISKALEDCDIITEPYRQYCYDGVFMENSSSPSSRVFDPKDPWKFCTDLDVRYHRNCARYQSQIFLGKMGHSNPLDEVGGLCTKGPSILLRQTCYQSLGFYVTQGALGAKNKILQNCAQMPTLEGKEICSTGAAIESVFQKYEGYVETSHAICNTLTMLKKTECLANIERMINPNVQN
ncbi:hypothetical protein H0W91_02095 [Patescibacteria group bacterium]|nr:hypothetical protein [Patescibacteria group bacterium]